MRNARIAVITQAVKLADEAAGLNRTSYIAELLAREGHDVDLLTSTFQHWEKKRRDIVNPKYHELPYEVIFIEEPGYSSNINPIRIYSQRLCQEPEYLSRALWCGLRPHLVPDSTQQHCRHRGDVRAQD